MEGGGYGHEAGNDSDGTQDSVNHATLPVTGSDRSAPASTGDRSLASWRVTGDRPLLVRADRRVTGREEQEEEAAEEEVRESV